MSILPIVTVPDRRLRRKSSLVGVVDDNLRRLLDDMLATMYAAPGIGLSAIQVDIPKRVIVIDVGPDEARQPHFMINPEILGQSDSLVAYDEGCLSLPEQYAEVLRPEKVSIGYLDYHGKAQTLEADGLLARCIQHEMDHLDGILFVDHLSALKRNIIIRRLTKQQRQKAAV